jgi:hypothetical protein
MLNLLTYEKPLLVNGKLFENAAEAFAAFKDSADDLKIELHLSDAEIAEKRVSNSHIIVDVPAASSTPSARKLTVYKLIVRQYMTKHSSPGFDFMKKYNDDNPMPMRVMYGVILQETPGMYKMQLHCRAHKDSVHCSHCMRELTHPISRVYGVGPICGEHYWQADEWIKSLANDEEALFKEADKRLRQITWEGWIPKKALESFTPLLEKMSVEVAS